MVSYGDITAFNAVKNAYDGCKVEKLDCVGHVQKRMGKHLMNLKATTKIAQNYLFKHTYHAHTLNYKPDMLLIVWFFYHLTLNKLTHLNFIFSLEDDVMATSKLCAFLLIFILKNFYYLAFPPYCSGLDYAHTMQHLSFHSQCRQNIGTQAID